MSGNFAIKGGGVRRLMANAILNFHFDYWHTSLRRNHDWRLMLPEPWSGIHHKFDEDIHFRYGLIKLILILIKLCRINNNNSCDSCDNNEDSDNCRQFSPKIDWLHSDLDCKHSCGQKPTFVSKRCIECKAEPLLLLPLLLVNKRGNQKFQFLEAPLILSAGMHIV